MTRDEILAAVARGADLRGAYLRGAYLSGANLSGADLSGTDLRGAYLRGAYLSGANLRGADLRGAYLSGADLSGADLSGTDLSGTDLSGARIGDYALVRLVARAGRMDGYEFLLFATETDALIRAGCQTRTVASYRGHVETDYPGTPKARETLAILDYFDRRLADA